VDAAVDAPKPPAGQAFEILAGGGKSTSAERALDLELSGTVRDLEVAPDGTAYLLMSDGATARLERIRPDGTHATISLLNGRHIGTQLAVGPDGSVYVNLYWGEEKKDAVYRIRPDGTRQPVITYNAGAVAPGKRSIGVFSALTVDPQGRLVFAVDVSTRGTAGVLIRRLEADGTVRTIAGRATRFTDLGAAQEATPTAVHPPASGKALDWGTTAAMHVPELAARPDGTIVLATTDLTSGASARTILAVTPDGSLRELAEGTPDGLPVAPAPFTREGDVRKVGNLITGLSASGDLLAVATMNGSGKPPAGGNYDWAGEHTAGQRAVLENLRGFEIRLVKPDGSVSTAAFGDRFALHGDQLYVVVRNLAGGSLLLGRIKIPA
jgi:hypothetical protein